jgi:N-acyl-D-amino-acid deacylase
VMPFAMGVRRSTLSPAAMLGIANRGTLAPNAFADVVVFDPATFTDRATYEEPTKLASGMKYVIVNGVVAVDDGTYTGATAGRVLKP